MRKSAMKEAKNKFQFQFIPSASEGSGKRMRCRATLTEKAARSLAGARDKLKLLPLRRINTFRLTEGDLLAGRVELQAVAVEPLQLEPILQGRRERVGGLAGDGEHELIAVERD